MRFRPAGDASDGCAPAWASAPCVVKETADCKPGSSAGAACGGCGFAAMGDGFRLRLVVVVGEEDMAADGGR